MEAPMPTKMEEKKLQFKNNQGKTIEVKMYIKENNINFKTELNENKLNKRYFSSKYSVDTLKEKNKFFFLYENINDIYKQIDSFVNENLSSYILESNKINLIIPTHMQVAPEIKIELSEEEKDLSTKVNELNEYILNTEKTNENNISLLIKENKEMKELINILIKENKEMKETIKSIKNNSDNIMNYIKNKEGILDEKYFDKIKEWIGGDKDKIKFQLIFNLNNIRTDQNGVYNNNCNINAPAIFIFITDKNSIFGAYCPSYNCNGSQWISDTNAFIFSLNLNKKYPAKKSGNNYYRGTCGFHFTDITFCNLTSRKVTLNNSIYLDNLELEGNNNSCYVLNFLVYRVIKM